MFQTGRKCVTVFWKESPNFTAEVGHFGNASCTPDSNSKFNLSRYSESSNNTVLIPLSINSILIYLFCFNARLHLSSLLIILGVGDLDLSNMYLIFQMNSMSIDRENYGITDSTAHIVSRWEHGYDTAKFKTFFSTNFSV